MTNFNLVQLRTFTKKPMLEVKWNCTKLKDQSINLILPILINKNLLKFYIFPYILIYETWIASCF